MGSQCSTQAICSPHVYLGDSFIAKSSITSAQTSINNIERFHELLNHISHKTWAHRANSLLNTELFFSNYKGYLRDQAFIMEIWESVRIEDDEVAISPKRSQSEVALPRLKHLIRMGVPLDKFREVVLEMFRKTYSSTHLEYEGALNVVFEGNVPETFKNVPLFSDSNQIEEVLPIHFLTEKGLHALKKILWVCEKTTPLLEYSPLLSQVVSILLIFLSEDEVYSVVKEMLEQSEALLNKHDNLQGLQSLKWYFTFSEEDFEVFLESLCSYCNEPQNGLRNLFRHFHSIGCDSINLFWELHKTLLFEFLPLSLSLKIFQVYLNEGIKIYYRFSLAILKIFQNSLLSCNSRDEVINLLKSKCQNIVKSEVQSLIITAYSLNFSQLKKQIPKIHPETLRSPGSSRPFLPRLSALTTTIDSKHFETIWEWLPFGLKLANPTLAFSTKIHGWSFNTLYSKCLVNNRYEGVLIIIKSLDNIVFGAFIDGVLRVTGDEMVSEGTDGSFVFQLEPEEKKYGATGKNHVHLICEKESLSIGVGNKGSAIYMLSNLQYGYSYASETYDNSPLNRRVGDSEKENRFECASFEVYWVG